MTAQTVSNAVAKRDTGPAALVRQSRDWFNTIVPSHVDANAFVALTIACLRKNPALARAAENNAASFMAALSDCARLGLVPGDTYHLVPFGSEITGIVDYKGEIEMIYRAGAVASVKAEIVCKNDDFRFTTDMDRPEHAPNWFGDRGGLVGAYAYAVMHDGATSKVIVYSKAEIDAVKAVSKTSKRSDSPWVLWYDRMALKTVIHRLSNFVPTSAEYRREQLRAAAEISQQVNSAPARAVDTGTGEVVDAEVVGEQDASPAGEQPGTPARAASPVPPEDPAGEALPPRGDPAYKRAMNAAQAQLKRFCAGGTEEELAEAKRVLAARVLRSETVVPLHDLTVDELRDVSNRLGNCGTAGELEALLKTGEVHGA